MCIRDRLLDPLEELELPEFDEALLTVIGIDLEPSDDVIILSLIHI